MARDCIARPECGFFKRPASEQLLFGLQHAQELLSHQTLLPFPHGRDVEGAVGGDRGEDVARREAIDPKRFA